MNRSLEDTERRVSTAPPACPTPTEDVVRIKPGAFASPRTYFSTTSRAMNYLVLEMSITNVADDVYATGYALQNCLLNH